MPFDEELVRIGDYRYDSGYEAMKQLLELEDPPTAVFCASDEMAVGAIHTINKGCGYPMTSRSSATTTCRWLP